MKKTETQVKREIGRAIKAKKAQFEANLAATITESLKADPTKPVMAEWDIDYSFSYGVTR